ncbi:MAG: restriction endonuclease [Aggregatilineales bacterium]
MSTEPSGLPTVYVVRAEFGKYAEAFHKGGYVGIGWFPDIDLHEIWQQGRDALRKLYDTYEPDASLMRKAVNVGQVWAFLNDLTLGTIVVTPTENTDKLLVGTIAGDYYYLPGQTDSPYPHRRAVDWNPDFLWRSTLSVPTQNTLRSSLTIFTVSQVDEIAEKLGLATPDLKVLAITEKQLHKQILDRILQLSADEFETLVSELLAAIGFVDTSKVGKVGDNGIDVEGSLEVYTLARMKLKVQVKRYSNAPVDHKAIHNFRASVPQDSEGAFVTTSDFTKKAREEADKTGFKRIGLVNGEQIVGILIERYDALPDTLKQKLRLRPTLMPE